MAPHSFRIGQTVDVSPGRMVGTKGGPFTILRLLPNDGLDREYRVKHVIDGHERVVHQSEIVGEVPGSNNSPPR